MQTLSKRLFRLLIPPSSLANRKRERGGGYTTRLPSTYWKQNVPLEISPQLTRASIGCSTDTSLLKSAHLADYWRSSPEALVRSAEICHFVSSARNCACQR